MCVCVFARVCVCECVCDRLLVVLRCLRVMMFAFAYAIATREDVDVFKPLLVFQTVHSEAINEQTYTKLST